MGLNEAHITLNINKLFVFVRDVTVSSILLDGSVKSVLVRSWTLDRLFRKNCGLVAFYRHVLLRLKKVCQWVCCENKKGKYGHTA